MRSGIYKWYTAISNPGSVVANTVESVHEIRLLRPLSAEITLLRSSEITQETDYLLIQNVQGHRMVREAVMHLTAGYPGTNSIRM